MKKHFDHERLDAYQVALDFVCLANETCGGLPRGWSSLADQLRRAAISVPLNIAEGAGEFSQKEKERFYRMPAGRRPSAQPSWTCACVSGSWKSKTYMDDVPCCFELSRC